MATNMHTGRPAVGGANARIVLVCLLIVAGMGGLAYASVPLYRLFCQVTGYGGTTRQAETATGVPVLDRTVTVRFDANTAAGLAWDFRPAQRAVTVRLGEPVQVAYVARNDSNRPVAASATFNVTPPSAGAYFNKLECFCFTEITLEPGQKLEMPVVFFVDPDMVGGEETRDIRTLTLSYTFYPKPGPGVAVRRDARPQSPAGG